MMDATCPLCARIAVATTVGSEDLVWKFPNSVAFLGPWQFYEGYCILISRVHATELSQLAVAQRSAFLEEMCTLARAIELAFQPHKLNYELLGNQVPHLHWHILPRYRNDAELLKPVWLALDRAERDETERRRLAAGKTPSAAIADRLRAQLGRFESVPTASLS
jgi:diadenosine tetraphosphate (Ap4A) HIT family hydrolase